LLVLKAVSIFSHVSNDDSFQSHVDHFTSMSAKTWYNFSSRDELWTVIDIAVSCWMTEITSQMTSTPCANVTYLTMELPNCSTGPIFWESQRLPAHWLQPGVRRIWRKRKVRVDEDEYNSVLDKVIEQCVNQQLQVDVTNVSACWTSLLFVIKAVALLASEDWRNVWQPSWRCKQPLVVRDRDRRPTKSPRRCMGSVCTRTALLGDLEIIRSVERDFIFHSVAR